MPERIVTGISFLWKDASLNYNQNEIRKAGLSKFHMILANLNHSSILLIIYIRYDTAEILDLGH